MASNAKRVVITAAAAGFQTKLEDPCPCPCPRCPCPRCPCPRCPCPRCPCSQTKLENPGRGALDLALLFITSWVPFNDTTAELPSCNQGQLPSGFLRGFQSIINNNIYLIGALGERAVPPGSSGQLRLRRRLLLLDRLLLLPTLPERVVHVRVVVHERVRVAARAPAVRLGALQEGLLLIMILMLVNRGEFRGKLDETEK